MDGVVRQDLLLARLKFYFHEVGVVRHDLLLARQGMYTNRLGLYAANCCLSCRVCTSRKEYRREEER